MELAARIGTMKTGVMKTTITMSVNTTNMEQIANEIIARLGDIGIESAVVSYPGLDFDKLNKRFCEGIILLGEPVGRPKRFVNSVQKVTSWTSNWDGIVRVGDIYDVYPISLPLFERPWGGVLNA